MSRSRSTALVLAGKELHELRLRRRRRRTLLTVVCGAAAGLVFIGSCERQPAPWAKRPQLAATAGPPVRLTIPPGSDSTVLVKTLPDAECVIHPANQTAADDRGALLYTDTTGTGRFVVRPTKSEVTTSFAMRCEAAGKAVTHAIELRISTTPTAEMPAPAAPPAAAVPPGGKIRPALTMERALGLSEDELIAAGYPTPPDLRTAPRAHAAWLQSVTRPMVILPPHTIMSSRIRNGYNQPIPRSGCQAPAKNGPGTSQNWSGIAIQGAPGSVGYVRAFWKVPSVTGEPGATSWSSTWIGIDGTNTNDLVQTGTEQDITATNAAQVFTHRAWTEILPQQQTEAVLSNFTVNAGDEVFAEMWIGNAGKGPDLSGFFGVFWLINTTGGYSTQIYTPLGSTTVGGSQAEWIMERPTLPSGLADLADYNAAQFYYAYARRPLSAKGQGYFNCCDSPSLINYTMFNGATTLSTVAVADAQTMNFAWHAFH